MLRIGLFGTLVCLAAVGCADTTENMGPDLAFVDGQGQLELAGVPYPGHADIGKIVGTAVPNWPFIGFANSENASLPGLQQIALSDFYNPHGYEYAACLKSGATDCVAKFPDAVFPALSHYGAGQPKPRALSVGQSAVWCGPCNAEAKLVLPGKAKAYLPKGGQFIVGLVDGPTPGESATYSDLAKWTAKYEVAYPLVTDPNGFLSQLFPPAYPSNAIVRTSDMRIVFVIAGAPNDADGDVCKQYPKEESCHYWSEFEKVLASGN